MSRSLWAAALLAVVIGLSVVWAVFGTVERARRSNQSVVHTQEVLGAIETVFSGVSDADATVRASLAPGNQTFDPLDQPERTVEADLNRLAALTADNAGQAALVQQLRQDVTRTLAGLRARLDAQRQGLVPPDADAERANLEAVRATLRTMRTAENQLLTERVQVDRAGIERLQALASALALAAVGLIASILWLLASHARRQQEGAHSLRQVNEGLEAQVSARSAELREANARLQSIIDSAVDGIIVIDVHGRIEAFNPGAERLFGRRERDVLGCNVTELMPSPYHEEHDWYLSQYLATGVQKVIGTGREVVGRREDGSTFPVHLSVGTMTVNGATKFTGILHDLTERVAIEAQLREQATLVRLGEMAAVIAHEVRNPLAGIRGAIQLIGMQLPPDSEDALTIRDIVSRIDTLSELMKDMLLFARAPQLKPIATDVSELMATTTALLRSDPALQGVDITVEGTLPAIVADPDLLQIAFTNLLVNGAHAMNGHGTIRVSLAVVGDTCQIAFADGGPGIPVEVRERIFQPFFTTKRTGSGLGLPTVKRLVEAHRGVVSITCPATGGTIVTVALPAALTQGEK